MRKIWHQVEWCVYAALFLCIFYFFMFRLPANG